MNMLGHHEFGLGRRDFKFNGESFEFHDSDDRNYWLERWIDYYQFSLTIDHSAVHYVSNQSIAENPEVISKQIFSVVELDPQKVRFEPPKIQRDIEQPKHMQLSQEFVVQAREIYRNLQKREFHILPLQ